MKKYWYTSNPEMHSKWGSHLMMLEASGILAKNKVVEPELFYDLGAYGPSRHGRSTKTLFQERELYMAKMPRGTLSS